MAHGVPIRSAEELEMARRSARLAAEVLEMIGPSVVPGVSTETLDCICHAYIVDVQGAIPANVGVNPSLTITALAEHAMSHVPAAGGQQEPGHLVA